MEKDVHDFTRKLRLVEYFAEENDSENNESISSLVRNKSTYTPPRNRNKFLDTAVDFLNNQNFVAKNLKNKSNISKNEWQAINYLKDNKDVIIKEADKGGSVVVMNKKHYHDMIMTHLNDSNIYSKIDSNCDMKVITKLKKLIEKYKDCLTTKEKDYLINFRFSSSNFYGLPKIHKSKVIKTVLENQNKEYIEAFEPSDLTLRPIVAGPTCPTRKLSDLIDKILKPFLIHIKSYIKDNIDFLSKCSRQNDENTIIATFDVIGLYSNIPHCYGLEAIEYWINKYPQLLDRFSKEFVLESTKFILENNNFKFDNIFYNQIKGTAMGTIFAPVYANLTMGYFELQFYDICRINFGHEQHNFICQNWKRYLDDCQTLLQGDKINPDDLLSVLNSVHPSIQFTMEYSKKEIPFLDILIKRNNEKIWMDVYHKPTDTHRCLPFSSSHPNHCKRNIPFILARRICMISENSNEKEKHIDDLRYNLAKSGYPRLLIESGIKRALHIPQEELRQPKVFQNNNNLSFITTFNPNNPNSFDIAKKSIECLKQNNVNGFQNISLLQSKRQPPNLKRILTKAEFSNPVAGVYSCDDKRCDCCHALYINDRYTFKNTNKTFVVKSRFSCDSSNLLYVIFCPSCGEEYIGETGIGKTKLRDRVRVYRQHIKQPEYQQLKVEEHLRTCGKGAFKIFPLLQMRSNDTDLRRSYEKRFQMSFKPKLNKL